MKPGLRKEWAGRQNVLLTHPRSRNVSCVLSRRVEVPIARKTALRFAVTNHPEGDWTLVARVGGNEVLKQSVEDSNWKEFRIDLTKHARKTVNIELENRASDWAFEAVYWSRIELQDER